MSIYEILSKFWLGIVNFKKREALNKISEDLMSIAWHSKRWWNFCILQDEKKDIESIFTV